MINTFVVNMEKDVRKRTEILSQLDNQKGLNTTLIKAVEGRKLSETEISRLVDMPALMRRHGRKATLPAIGCSLSHLYIYDTIVSDGLDYALILEDDAILSPNLHTKINECEIIMQSQDPAVILLTPEFIYNRSSIFLSKGDCDIYELGSGLMTSGYLINQSAARLLSKRLRPVRYLADEWGKFVSMGLNLYGIVPHIISFPDGLGEIGHSQLDGMKVSFSKRIKSRLAKIMFAIQMKNMNKKGIFKSEKLW